MVIVIAAKLVTLFLLASYLTVPWQFSFDGNGYVTYFISFADIDNLAVISNFSDLVMVLVVAVGFVWVIFRAHHFREDKIHPHLAAKLHQKNRQKLIISAFEIYHQALIWLALSWFTLFLITTNIVLGYTSTFILGLAMAVSVGLTFILWKDLKELQG